MNIWKIISLAVTATFLVVLIDDIRLRKDQKNLVLDIEQTEYLKNLQKQNYTETQKDKQSEVLELQSKLDELAPVLINDVSINNLRKKGLINPTEDLRNSLIENQSKLLTDSIRDGRQRFIKEHIHIINEKWVIAYWEAGHSAGNILASYNIGDRAKITWNIIDEMQ